RRRADGPLPPAGSGPPVAVPGAGRDRHRALRRTGLRLRLPLLRAPGGRARGPGDGVGPLLPGTLLGRTPGEARLGGLPGIGARRDRPRRVAREPGRTQRPGRHRAERGVARMNLGPGRPRAAIDAAPTVASRGDAAGKMVVVLSPDAGE